MPRTTTQARGMRKSVHTQASRLLCELMVEARTEAGLTQRMLAARLGKPQSFVAKYETGERRLDVIEFLAVARAMETDPVELVREFLRRSDYD